MNLEIILKFCYFVKYFREKKKKDDVKCLLKGIQFWSSYEGSVEMNLTSIHENMD